MLIRSEAYSDAPAIRQVVQAAFGGPAEADLVDRLRATGDIAISLVAADDDRVIGHVLFCGMRAPFPALGLAPVSVAPEHQRRGIGNQLIRRGIADAEAAGWHCIFVLGDPGYYRRFGFDVALASGFTSRYAGPLLMALALGSRLPILHGEIEYPPAFGLLDQ
jgi:putative acetyltransferase